MVKNYYVLISFLFHFLLWGCLPPVSLNEGDTNDEDSLTPEEYYKEKIGPSDPVIRNYILDQVLSEGESVALDLAVDEGGGVTQDDKNVTIRITSQNPNVVDENLDVYINGVKRNTYTTEDPVGVSADFMANTEVLILPDRDRDFNGVATFKVELSNEGGATYPTYQDFKVTWRRVNDVPTAVNTTTSTETIDEDTSLAYHDATIDEGGGSYEDSDRIFVKFRSSNLSLAPLNSIRGFWNSRALTTRSPGVYEIPKGTQGAQLYPLKVRVIPTANAHTTNLDGSVTPIKIFIDVSDTGGSNWQSSTSFDLIVTPVIDPPVITAPGGEAVPAQTMVEDTNHLLSIIIDEGGSAYDNAKNIQFTIDSSDSNIIDVSKITATSSTGSITSQNGIFSLNDGNADSGLDIIYLTIPTAAEHVTTIDGPVTISIKASNDDDSFTWETTESFELTVSEFNDPPYVLNYQGSEFETMAEGTTLTHNMVTSEGGGSSEYYQSMKILVVSNNQNIIRGSDISILWKDSPCVSPSATANTFTCNLPDGTVNSLINLMKINIRPDEDVHTQNTGAIKLDVYVRDSDTAGNPSTEDPNTSFFVTINKVDDVPTLVAAVADATVEEDENVNFSINVDEGGGSDEDYQYVKVKITSNYSGDAAVGISLQDGNNIYTTTEAVNASAHTQNISVAISPPYVGYNGTLSYTVSLDDFRGAYTIVDNFFVTWTPVESPPSIDANDATVSIQEDGIIAGLSFNIDEGGGIPEDNQTLVVRVYSGDQNIIDYNDIVATWRFGEVLTVGACSNSAFSRQEDCTAPYTWTTGECVENLSDTTSAACLAAGRTWAKIFTVADMDNNAASYPLLLNILPTENFHTSGSTIPLNVDVSDEDGYRAAGDYWKANDVVNIEIIAVDDDPVFVSAEPNDRYPVDGQTLVEGESISFNLIVDEGGGATDIEENNQEITIVFVSSDTGVVDHNSNDIIMVDSNDFTRLDNKFTLTTTAGQSDDDLNVLVTVTPKQEVGYNGAIELSVGLSEDGGSTVEVIRNVIISWDPNEDLATIVNMQDVNDVDMTIQGGELLDNYLFQVDEGGGVDENNQMLYVAVRSSIPDRVQNSDITLSWGQNELFRYAGDVDRNIFIIGDTNYDANSQSLSLKVAPDTDGELSKTITRVEDYDPEIFYRGDVNVTERFFLYDNGNNTNYTISADFVERIIEVKIKNETIDPGSYSLSTPNTITINSGIGVGYINEDIFVEYRANSLDYILELPHDHIHKESIVLKVDGVTVDANQWEFTDVRSPGPDTLTLKGPNRGDVTLDYDVIHTTTLNQNTNTAYRGQRPVTAEDHGGYLNAGVSFDLSCLASGECTTGEDKIDDMSMTIGGTSYDANFQLDNDTFEVTVDPSIDPLLEGNQILINYNIESNDVAVALFHDDVISDSLAVYMDGNVYVPPAQWTLNSTNSPDSLTLASDIIDAGNIVVFYDTYHDANQWNSDIIYPASSPDPIQVELPDNNVSETSISVAIGPNSIDVGSWNLSRQDYPLGDIVTLNAGLPSTGDVVVTYKYPTPPYVTLSLFVEDYLPGAEGDAPIILGADASPYTSFRMKIKKDFPAISYPELGITFDEETAYETNAFSVDANTLMVGDIDTAPLAIKIIISDTNILPIDGVTPKWGTKNFTRDSADPTVFLVGYDGGEQGETIDASTDSIYLTITPPVNSFTSYSEVYDQDTQYASSTLTLDTTYQASDDNQVVTLSGENIDVGSIAVSIDDDGIDEGMYTSFNAATRDLLVFKDIPDAVVDSPMNIRWSLYAPSTQITLGDEFINYDSLKVKINTRVLNTQEWTKTSVGTAAGEIFVHGGLGENGEITASYNRLESDVSPNQLELEIWISGDGGVNWSPKSEKLYIDIISVNDPPFIVNPNVLTSNPNVLEEISVAEGNDQLFNLVVDEGGEDNEDWQEVTASITCQARCSHPEHVFDNANDIRIDGADVNTITTSTGDDSADQTTFAIRILRPDDDFSNIDPNSEFTDPNQGAIDCTIRLTDNGRDPNSRTYSVALNWDANDDLPTIADADTNLLRIRPMGQDANFLLKVDEGGGVNEDYQNLKIKVVEYDSNLIDSSDIKFSWNGTPAVALPTGGFSLADGNDDANDANVVVNIATKALASRGGPSRLTVELTDDVDWSRAQQHTFWVEIDNNDPTITRITSDANINIDEGTMAEHIFRIDEGDLNEGDESGQGVSVKVEISDEAVPLSNVMLRWGENAISRSDTNINDDPNAFVVFYNVDGESDANTAELKINFIPETFAVANDINIKISVSDDGGLTWEDSLDYDVNIIPFNNLPTITNIATQTTNENTEILGLKVKIDEGGGDDEEIQEMSVKIYSSDEALFPLENIKANRNGAAEISFDGEYQSLGDGTTESDIELTIDLLPASAQSGGATITVEVRDSGEDPNVGRMEFTVFVEQLNLVHNGWSQVYSVGPRQDMLGATVTDEQFRIIGTDRDANTFTFSGDVTEKFLPKTKLHVIHSTGNDTPPDDGYTIETSEVVDSNTLLTVSGLAIPSTSQDGRGYNDDSSAQVRFAWNEMGLDNATISGWNVYRISPAGSFEQRPSGSPGEGDFSEPLNNTPLDANTRSYIDSDVAENTTYAYQVRPIIDGIATGTVDNALTTLKVEVPGANEALVHRWMANIDMCARIGELTDSSNNYRCEYIGPGNTSEMYYDLGRSIIVDRYEAGCKYSNSDYCNADGGGEAGGCIGTDVDDPNDPATKVINFKNSEDENAIYYSRSSGKCYINKAADANDVWQPINGESGLASNAPFLPPITQVSRSDADTLCSSKFLPTRKQQMAYSSWSSTLDDAAISTLETGATLNTVSGCNTNEASGVLFNSINFAHNAYVDTISGSSSNNIRSLATGSKATRMCTSRYGIQDVVGNVREWTKDSVDCSGSEGEICMLSASTIPFNDTLDSGAAYNFDSRFGPCADSILNSDGSEGSDDWCDTEERSALGTWAFADTSFANNDATKFFAPLGLPGDDDITTYYTYQLIGADDVLGITAAQLHEDIISVNALRLKGLTLDSNVVLTEVSDSNYVTTNSTVTIAAINNNYAVTADDTNLIIINTKLTGTDTNVVFQSSIDLGNVINDVDVYSSSLILAATEGGLKSIRIDTSMVPSLINTYDPNFTEVEKVVVDSTKNSAYIYREEDPRELHIVDISDPNAMTARGTYTPSQSIQSIDYLGDYIYFVTDDNLVPLNISDPSNPQVGVFYNDVDNGKDFEFRDLIVEASNIYAVSATTDDFLIFELTDPDKPIFYSSMNSSIAPVHMAKDGDYVIIAGGDDIAAIDVSNVTVPVEETSTTIPPASFQQLVINNEVVYLATGSGNQVRFINIYERNLAPSIEYTGVGYFTTGGSYTSGGNTAGVYTIEVLPENDNSEVFTGFRCIKNADSRVDD
ncbi:MAG: hypothetical protein ISR65_00075 [Bacteriovoracaceae bacterium]|nr:hypothetical protein [Bacteriovoracaceae bacterium]